MSPRMFSVVLLFAAVVLVSADSNEFPGPCPNVAVKENFDDVKFASKKWHMVAETEGEEDYKCFTVEINPTEKTIHQIGTEKDGDAIDRTDHYTTTSPGTYTITESDGDTDDYTVIATDYDNYAVVRNCEFDSKDNDHEENIYIYVDESHVANPQPTLDQAKAAIADKGLQVTQYTLVPGCSH